MTKTVVEGPPDSILSLATFLLGALRYTGDPGAFSEGRIVDEFLTEATELVELLRSGVQEVGVAQDGLDGSDPES